MFTNCKKYGILFNHIYIQEAVSYTHLLPYGLPSGLVAMLVSFLVYILIYRLTPDSRIDDEMIAGLGKER